MSLSLWGGNTWFDPLQEFDRLRRDMNRLFDVSSFGASNAEGAEGRENSGMSFWRPRVDVAEREDSLIVHAELPGVPKDQINLEVNNGMLTLSGERKHEKKEENEQYHRIERSYGRFSRSLPLPEGVDPQSIKANYDNGVLEISIPKPAESRPKRFSVSIGGPQKSAQGQIESGKGVQSEQKKLKSQPETTSGQAQQATGQTKMG